MPSRLLSLSFLCLFLCFASMISAPAQTVTFSPTSLSFGNVILDDTSAYKDVSLENTGTATLYVNSITASGNFAISSTTCGATLAANKKCTVSVTFTPTGLGALTGTLSVYDNAANSPQTVALSGKGVMPATLTPVSATYAAQAVDTTSAAKTFTLTNNQTVALTDIVVTTNGDDFAVSATTCTTSLAARGKCTISVTFTPVATGARTGQLSTSNSASNSPQTVSLMGTGDAQVTWTPTSLTFAAQTVGTTSAAKNVILTNNLPTALSIISITVSAALTNCANPTSVNGYTMCGTPVYNDVNGSSVSVSYSPSAGNGIIAVATACFVSSCNTSTSGVTFTMGDNINPTETCFSQSPNSPFISDGNGQPQGLGDFQQWVVFYRPSIPSGVTTFTMTPSGSSLHFLQLAISEWQAGSLAATCSPISACFENVDSVGEAGNTTGGLTATITTSGPTVNANDLIVAATEFPYSKTQTPGFTISPGSGYTGIVVSPSQTPDFVWEAMGVNSPETQTATSTWNCNTPADCTAAWFGVIAPIKAYNDDYAQTNTCGSSVASKSKCTISVTFTPQATGTRRATLNINDSANSSPQTVNLKGTGK